ncbi:gp16 family protein [Photobacterium sanguinicancri]|uniref:gp16 family protein n=1 Tax=Photobacterium sanguinicancri TaxID=875932 RepID=UPI0026E2C1BF|nr:regulatory protein GemA [Photobacterium sanguinicancri]MDO6497349.1 regulatory protein GemA [Photobacterium sanguinicancri]
MNPRNRLIQLIHVGKRELALDDDTYRALLFANGEHSSCSKMNIKQLENVLAVMEIQGFKRMVNGNSKSFKKRLSPKSGKAKHSQIDKIRAVWISLYQHQVVRDKSENALDAYVRRMTNRNKNKGVDHVGWLDSSQAYMVLEALKSWHRRELVDRLKEAGYIVPMNKSGTGLAGYDAVVDAYAFMLGQQLEAEDD